MNKKILIALAAMAIISSSSLAALTGELGILVTSGNNPATGAPWAAGDAYRLVFTTSATHDAQSDDISVYNAWVQGLADAAGLGGTWKVIGSTETVDARDNTGTNPEDSNSVDCPIILIDGATTVATGNADLWDGEIAHIIDKDENGGQGYPHLWVFTGTVLDGTAAPGNFGPLGKEVSGSVTQGNGGSTSQWIWRTWTGASADSQLAMYAMSDPLYVIDGDPTRPDVDAGEDMITWLDEPVVLDPVVVNNDTTDLTYYWTAQSPDPNILVTFTPAVNAADPNTSAELAPAVTVSRIEGETAPIPAIVRLTLAVNNVGSGKDDVKNSMIIDVYEDSCAAANAVAPVDYDLGDVNKDCVTNLLDFLKLAESWLNDYRLQAPVAKP